MAEEEVVEAEGAAEEEEEAKAPKDTTKLFIIALVGLSIVLMILTPIVTIMMVKTMIPEVNTEPEQAKTSDELVEYVIEGIQCNLAGSQGTRYIRLNIAVTFNKAKLKEFFEEPAEGEATEGRLPNRKNRIRADLVKIISDKQVDNLESVEDKEKLASDIKHALNAMFKKDLLEFKLEDASILEVYFPDFLIQ